MNQELIDKIALLKEELRELIDNAEIEKRSLNDDEKSLFETKENELKDLQVQLRSTEIIENTNKTDKKNMKRNFRENIAVAMQAIANNRSVENLENVAGNVISLRAITSGETLTGEVDAIRGEYATELLEPLQDALIVDKLGIKVITTSKAVVMPSVSSVEASIEGEVTELVGQKLEFSKSKVVPFRVGLSLPFSNTAIKEADINLVNYAINLAGKSEAQLINKVMFAKEAVNSQKGCFVDAYAAETGNTAISYKNIVKLAAKVKKANVIFDNTAAYVVSPEIEAELKTTPLDAGSGRMVLEGGMMNGFPVLVSNAVEGYIGFGVFSNYLIQKVGTPDMVVDNLSRSKENITEINFNDNVALQVIRKEAFAVMKIA
ncbi:phage major capsid protein [uncultured Bacteroides sp.]|jgi:HK97 family phage major capsid protein|uniref:phage major capsid protein n=1 Tax=uncultured Bacteroides sp. TaxID=162156 RepID=UPI0008228142|nr:phage major capsid protein [uncultured Bacteroides sp.]SCH15564.1 Predicted phage phi-C31 gp36 major capsid-like protein [uncultured Bacteroides sp.]